jgi:hypothetical protein
MAPRAFDTDRVGPYRILRALESEGTPSFVAREEGPVGFRRDVVLKFVAEGDPMQAPAAQDLAREATLGSRLNHPNIIRTHDFLQQDGRLVLVIEHVDGITLAHLLAALRMRRERLSDQATLYVGVAVLEALAHAHAQVDAAGVKTPIVHHRLDPTRVFLGKDGSVKLGGFSALSAAIDQHPVAGDAAAGPQTAQPLEGDKADVRAAGLLLWEMLTGREASAGLEPLSVVRSDLPRELSAAEVASWIKKVARFAAGRDEIRNHVLMFAPAEPEPAAVDAISESARIPLQGWSMRLAPIANRVLAVRSSFPRLDAAARNRLSAVRRSIGARWPKLDSLLRRHPQAFAGAGFGFILVIAILTTVRIVSHNTAHAAVSRAAAPTAERRFIAPPGPPPTPSALPFFADAPTPSPSLGPQPAKVAAPPTEPATQPKGANHAGAPASDDVETSPPPADKAAYAIPGGSSKPAPVPPKGFGYLTVHSSLGYAFVYVQLVQYGHVEHRLTVRCGKRFLSLGNPKPAGGEPIWFAPSRTVDIPCGRAVEITMMPKWIPKGG